MILINNNVIYCVSDFYEIIENYGYRINGVDYHESVGEIIDIECPTHVIPFKYCYTKEKGFYINEVWKNQTEQLINEAIDNMTLELIESGVL
ncbi:hypothetical protein [Vallitalea guaymasensis]|uniref:Uncharacterized protein n=1 Tax=Vallitalea guaymasensis TaxID=1185412 RepID=A0A8J8MC63_9FIRM|nr:hypothetical protein [Vallitalea guaymasensis]QUH30000.1 hypothetical protein HYG85_14185 [Vallitalea guaymasensis]